MRKWEKTYSTPETLGILISISPAFSVIRPIDDQVDYRNHRLGNPTTQAPVYSLSDPFSRPGRETHDQQYIGDNIQRQSNSR
jgi:hypothetical protein